MDISSPGTNLNRMMDSLGFPEQMGDVYGAALDEAIGDNLGVARNILDSMTPLSTSGVDRLIARGLVQQGAVERPHMGYDHHFALSHKSFYTQETITSGKLGGDPAKAAKLESEIMGNPQVRSAWEAKLGGRFLYDGKADGRMTLARPLPHSCVPFQGQAHRHVSGMLSRIAQPAHMNTAMQTLSKFLKATAPHIQLPPGSPMLKREKIEQLLPNTGMAPADLERRIKTDPKFRAEMESKIGARILPDRLTDGRITTVRFQPPSGTQAAGAAGAAGAQNKANPNDPSAILHDPNLSFEAKMGMFLFAFMEKKQKEIEDKMEKLSKEQQAGGGGGKKGGKKGGGKKGGKKGIGKGKGKKGGGMGMGGGLMGGLLGGPTGGTMGNNAGGQGGSDSIEMKKLEQMMQEMNKMFTMVDNMLKSMNDVVKQGPLASIRG